VSGEVTLLAVHEGQGAVLRLEFQASRSPVTFTRSALDEWRRAANVVLQTAPALALLPKITNTPHARLLRGAGFSDAQGGSFGLGFYMSHFCAQFGQDIPATIGFTACLNDNGTLGRVDGLGPKFRAAKKAGVQMVYVSSEQEDARDLAEYWGLDCHLAGSAVEVAEVFSQGMLKDWAIAADAYLMRDLVSLAFGNHESRPSWSGVALVCDELVQRPWLSVEDRNRVQLAQQVATRHQGLFYGVQPQTVMPQGGWLDRLPQPERSLLRAQVIQHAHDTGNPGLSDLPDLSGLIITSVDAFPAQLKLAGAWARKLLVGGRPADAYQIARECFEQWLLRGEAFQAGFSVTPMIQAGSHLGRFAESRGLVSGREMFGSEYVRLAFVSSIVLDPDATSSELERAVDMLAGFVGDYPGASACRWQKRARRRLGVAVADVELLDGVDLKASFSRFERLDELLYRDEGDAAYQLARGLVVGDECLHPLPEMVVAYQVSDDRLASFVADHFPY